MKAVVDDFKLMKNKVGERITPIFLYSIRYDEKANKWLRFSGCGRDITFDGITYKKFQVSHGDFNENLSGRVEQVNLRLGNITREIQYFLSTYDGLKGCRVETKLVWLEKIDDPSCFDESVFYVESCDADTREATLILRSDLDVLDIRLPKRTFERQYCRFRFKGKECGYSGAEESCNKTFDRCQELGNVSRYGGFPGVPLKRLVIE